MFYMCVVSTVVVRHLQLIWSAKLVSKPSIRWASVYKCCDMSGKLVDLDGLQAAQTLQEKQKAAKKKGGYCKPLATCCLRLSCSLSKQSQNIIS